MGLNALCLQLVCVVVCPYTWHTKSSRSAQCDGMNMDIDTGSGQAMEWLHAVVLKLQGLEFVLHHLGTF